MKKSLSVAVAVHLLGLVVARPAQFLEVPRNVTALLGDEDVTFSCHVEGDILFWRVNDTLYNYASIPAFKRRGIQAHMRSTTSHRHWETLTVRVSEQNNFTKVVCQGTVAGEISNYSTPAYLIIADVPLSPAVNMSLLNSDTLQLTWSPPHTWLPYPITSYSIVIETTDLTLDNSSMELANVTVDGAVFSYNVTSEEVPVCTLLLIVVSACSAAGRGDALTAMAALPDGPGEFLEDPRTDVKFSNTGRPQVLVNFTFPYLCPYSDATYTLELSFENGTLVLGQGPFPQAWQDGGEQKKTVLEGNSLVSNMRYLLTINVSTSVGYSSTNISLDTYFYPLSTTHTRSNAVKETTKEKFFLPTEYDKKGFTREITLLMAGIAAVIFLAILIVVMIILVFYCKKKWTKRKRACVDTVEHRTMVRNPIYEEGALYEEIPANLPPPVPPDRDDSYVTIATSSNNKNAAVVYDECKVADDSYLSMQSIGTVKERTAPTPAGPSLGRQPTYSNHTTTRVSSRGNEVSRQGPQPTVEEQEERYIIIVH